MDGPPGPPMQSSHAPKIRHRMAADLGIPADRIVLATDAGPFADRRVLRIIRDRIPRENVREEHFLIAPFEVGIRGDDGPWSVGRPPPAFRMNARPQLGSLWFALSASAQRTEES